MSTPTPAGWYQDPQNAQGLRWWDGARWTADTSGRPQPYTAGVAYQERAPEGADWRTPWIWLVLLLPLLPSIGIFLIDWRAFVQATLQTPTSASDALSSQLAVYTSPGILISQIGSWLVYALSIVFAYFDWKTLRDRGIPRPFHWAWAFLASTVYGIGRGVVTHRRGAGGRVVMWVAIAVLVAGILIGFIYAGWVFSIVFDEMSRSPYYSY